MQGHPCAKQPSLALWYNALKSYLVHSSLSWLCVMVLKATSHQPRKAAARRECPCISHMSAGTSIIPHKPRKAAARRKCPCISHMSAGTSIIPHQPRKAAVYRKRPCFTHVCWDQHHTASAKEGCCALSRGRALRITSCHLAP
eukprot:1141038-Pelagomonas_calceolata.AAC.3